MKEKSKNEELQALAYYAAHLLETRGPQFLTAAAWQQRRQRGEGGFGIGQRSQSSVGGNRKLSQANRSVYKM